MMAAKAKDAAKGIVDKKETRKETGVSPYIILGAVVIIIAAALAGYLLSVSNSASSGSFQSFVGGFRSAPRVAIFVNYTANSTYQYSVSCATAIIQQMITSRAYHRNSSTIDFLVIANSTSCITSVGGLGSGKGTNITSLSSCLAVSSNEPSIFISYSPTNSTTIKGKNLYSYGTSLFLSECGLSSEIG